MTFLLVFWIVLSIPLVYVSRASLRNPNAHGFYRFFAWEAILLLLLHNLPFWFHQPFTWHQLISWLLLIGSLLLVIFSLVHLRQKGAPMPERQDPALLSLEKTTQLVTTGIYRSIRHPMYCSLLFLAWGTFFKLPTWLGFILAVVATLSLVKTARLEEVENLSFFGAPYQEYMAQTKMFIPGLI